MRFFLVLLAGLMIFPIANVCADNLEIDCPDPVTTSPYVFPQGSFTQNGRDWSSTPILPNSHFLCTASIHQGIDLRCSYRPANGRITAGRYKTPYPQDYSCEVKAQPYCGFVCHKKQSSVSQKLSKPAHIFPFKRK